MRRRILKCGCPIPRKAHINRVGERIPGGDLGVEVIKFSKKRDQYCLAIETTEDLGNTKERGFEHGRGNDSRKRV